MTVPAAPTILVAVTPDSLHLTRTDHKRSHGPIGVSFASLTDKGHMGACHELGNLILRIVADAHPEIFAGYPVLTPPSSTHDPVTLAMALISLSLQQNTGDYVPTIDALVQRFADTFLKERWNQVRPKLVATLG